LNDNAVDGVELPPLGKTFMTGEEKEVLAHDPAHLATTQNSAFPPKALNIGSDSTSTVGNSKSNTLSGKMNLNLDIPGSEKTAMSGLFGGGGLATRTNPTSTARSIPQTQKSGKTTNIKDGLAAAFLAQGHNPNLSPMRQLIGGVSARGSSIKRKKLSIQALKAYSFSKCQPDCRLPEIEM